MREQSSLYSEETFDHESFRAAINDVKMELELYERQNSSVKTLSLSPSTGKGLTKQAQLLIDKTIDSLASQISAHFPLDHDLAEVLNYQAKYVHFMKEVLELDSYFNNHEIISHIFKTGSIPMTLQLDRYFLHDPLTRSAEASVLINSITAYGNEIGKVTSEDVYNTLLSLSEALSADRIDILSSNKKRQPGRGDAELPDPKIVAYLVDHFIEDLDLHLNRRIGTLSESADSLRTEAIGAMIGALDKYIYAAHNQVDHQFIKEFDCCC